MEVGEISPEVVAVLATQASVVEAGTDFVALGSSDQGAEASEQGMKTDLDGRDLLRSIGWALLIYFFGVVIGLIVGRSLWA